MLAWAVAGCLLYQREGLVTPEAIERATDDYRESMDPMGDFIRECCVIDPQARVESRYLRTAYMDYCADNGIRFTLSPRQWGERLCAMGFTSGWVNAKRGWIGISLRVSTSVTSVTTVSTGTFSKNSHIGKVIKPTEVTEVSEVNPAIDLLELNLDEDGPEA